MSQEWELNEQRFGPLLKYIQDDDVTDIDWDGNSLWIRRINQKKQKVEDEDVTQKFIESFSYFVQNHESKPFNSSNSVLTSDTETMRIVFMYNSLATTGIAMSIRKSLPQLRYTPKSAIEAKLCSKETMALLINCVLANCNMIFCGKPGDGKTEAAKFFSSFIRANEKVITVEEVREWHYHEINPENNCVEIKIKDSKDYEPVIKAALQLNPDWLMISEIRSREVQYLMEAMSTGVKGISTIHTDDTRKIADRILNMSGSMENPQQIKDNVYMFLDVGILITQVDDDKINTHRQIEQVAFYLHNYETGKNKTVLVVEDGILYPERIPRDIEKNIQKRAKTDNVFKASILEERL